MFVVFILLFLACLGAMILGLIKPSTFNKVFKGGVSRKKITLVFGIAAIVCFVIAIAITPEDLDKENKDGASKKVEANIDVSSNKSLDQRVADVLKDSFGDKTNTEKQKVVGIEINKYDAKALAQYGYKADDNKVGLTITINSNENLTTNLQKVTMYDEAAKIAKAVFPLDQNIVDIIIWEQLPIKDQYGNVKDGTAMAFSISRPTFEKINWDNFSYRDLPQLLKSENISDNRNNYSELIKF